MLLKTLTYYNKSGFLSVLNLDLVSNIVLVERNNCRYLQIWLIDKDDCVDVYFKPEVPKCKIEEIMMSIATGHIESQVPFIVISQLTCDVSTATTEAKNGELR